MAGDMLPSDAAEKLQSFWKKPEGKVGAVVAALLGGGALVGLYKALPFLITILENTLYASVLGVALFGILLVLMDPRFRALVGYMYKSVMRAVTGIFIELDPIGILNGYVQYLEKCLARMDRQIGNLNGQIRKLKEVIQQNKKKMEDAIGVAKAAKEKNLTNVFVLKSRVFGRLQNSNVTYQDLLTKMEVIYRVLQKMREVSEVMIEDIKGEVDESTRKREMILASHSALRSAMSIINGDKDRKAIFDQTMDYLATDYGMKMGEIEHFLTMSSSFIDSVDLQNGVFEENAMKMIEEWEKKGESLLLGSDKKALVAEAYDPDNELSLDTARRKARPGKGSELGSGGKKWTEGL